MDFVTIVLSPYEPRFPRIPAPQRISSRTLGKGSQVGGSLPMVKHGPRGAKVGPCNASRERGQLRLMGSTPDQKPLPLEVNVLRMASYWPANRKLLGDSAQCPRPQLKARCLGWQCWICFSSLAGSCLPTSPKWLRVKNGYPKGNPGKWNQGLNPGG